MITKETESMTSQRQYKRCAKDNKRDGIYDVTKIVQYKRCANDNKRDGIYDVTKTV
jgi:hypothetical protein